MAESDPKQTFRFRRSVDTSRRAGASGSANANKLPSDLPQSPNAGVTAYISELGSFCLARAYTHNGTLRPTSAADNAANEYREATHEQERAAELSAGDFRFDQERRSSHHGQNRAAQAGIADEHAEERLGDVADKIHWADRIVEPRSSAPEPSPTSRKAAAKTNSTRSPPGHAIPRPSPVQNTPNADRFLGRVLGGKGA
jgi:hypothetical protein